MQKEKKLNVLRSILGDYREKGNEAIFFCPKHGARAGRTDGQLSLNLETDWFNCWSCGFKGRNLVPLLKMGNDRTILAEYVGEREEFKPIVVEKKYDPPSLPKGFKTLSVPSRSPFYHRAMEYLADRGITSEDVLLWKLGYCDDGEYKNRIIIPSFDQYGQLNFVVGRSFYDSPRRYMHENLDKNIIWNEYMIDWSRPIVLTEGPFDAFVAHDNVTILQGTILPHALLRKIVLRGNEVYFAMDSDAIKKQLEHIKTMMSYGVSCRHVDLGGKKDVGSMTKEEFENRKSVARTLGDEFDLMKLRVNS